MVKFLRIKLSHLRIVVDKNGISFLLCCEKGGICWRFNCVDNVEKSEEMPVIAVVGGFKIKSFFMDDSALYTYINGDFEQTAKFGIDYIKSTFCGQFNPIAVLHTDDIPDENRPFFTGFSLCNKLTITGNKPMKEDEMEEILRKFPVENVISLAIPIRGTVKVNNWLAREPETFQVTKSGHCIDKSLLEGTKCRNIWINDCILPPDSCIEFVKRWLRSEDTKFNWLKLSWPICIPPNLNYESLGLELMPFDSNLRSNAYKYDDRNAVDLSSAQDFIRNDGMLASVAIIGRNFIFCVWHDRFPDTNGIPFVPF